MKLKELLNNISKLSSIKRKKQLEHCDCLKKTLKQLKKKSRELKEKISREDDKDKRSELKEKLKIAEAQRAKGLVLLKELRD